jgi:hypothetical protein
MVFGITRRRCDDSIQMYLKETGKHGVDWVHLDQDRDQRQALVNMAISLQVP